MPPEGLDSSSAKRGELTTLGRLMTSKSVVSIEEEKPEGWTATRTRSLLDA